MLVEFCEQGDEAGRVEDDGRVPRAKEAHRLSSHHSMLLTS